MEIHHQYPPSTRCCGAEKESGRQRVLILLCSVVVACMYLIYVYVECGAMRTLFFCAAIGAKTCAWRSTAPSLRAIPWYRLKPKSHHTTYSKNAIHRAKQRQETWWQRMEHEQHRKRSESLAAM